VKRNKWNECGGPAGRRIYVDFPGGGGVERGGAKQHPKIYNIFFYDNR